jgi:hypothetical protein
VLKAVWGRKDGQQIPHKAQEARGDVHLVLVAIHIDGVSVDVPHY